MRRYIECERRLGGGQRGITRHYWFDDSKPIKLDAAHAKTAPTHVIIEGPGLRKIVPVGAQPGLGETIIRSIVILPNADAYKANLTSRGYLVRS